MCWIREQLKKLDKNIPDDTENKIISIVYEDMVRNGKCTVYDFMDVIYGDNDDSKCISLQKKATQSFRNNIQDGFRNVMNKFH